MFIECIYQFIVSGVLEEIKKAVYANMTSVALLVAHIFYMAHYDSVEIKNKLKGLTIIHMHQGRAIVFLLNNYVSVINF